MTSALKAQERLNNAIAQLENAIENMDASATKTDVSEELIKLKTDNTRLKEAQSKAKLRLDTLIETISEGSV